MTAPARTLTAADFVLARLVEDEAAARAATPGQWEVVVDNHRGFDVPDVSVWSGVAVRYVTEDVGSAGSAPTWAANGEHIARHDPARVLAQCKALRAVVELHKSWPVLVQSPPKFERVGDGSPDRVAFRASQQMAWLTEQEYRERFGNEPPTAPMIRALASIWRDHPAWQEAWA